MLNVWFLKNIFLLLIIAVSDFSPIGAPTYAVLHSVSVAAVICTDYWSFYGGSAKRSPWRACLHKLLLSAVSLWLLKKTANQKIIMILF